MLYRLSEKFGWMPDEIRDMEARDVDAYLTIMHQQQQLNKARKGGQ